ncbi:MAG: 23S rRNA (pseudouridine(1915)-N(3))-methyltransferase RlmH [Geminicoccaceae bacterium]|nr:23S rRNA (pseudouridine(1915)-N(3))-methyltransferase RlmH [Geminicoccaceae bacterium]
MRLHLIAIGRLRDPPLEALIARYVERSPWPLRTVELVARGKAGGAAAETALLLEKVPEGARIVALDERGLDLSSTDFAGRLDAWRHEAAADVAFLVGGADGLAPTARERADLVLAFGRATWPHMLVRVMLAEQLWRAASIMAGHPYHRA